MIDIQPIIQNQKQFFRTGETLNLSFRLKQLKSFKKAIINYESEIVQALKDDFNKPVFETYASEICIVLDEIDCAIKNLHSWAKKKRVKTSILNFYGSSYIQSEPYGVVLIIGVWNYPIQLNFAPLVGAIGAGNCIIVKPPELSINSSRIITRIIQEIFNEEYICTVEGGTDVGKALVNEKFDYIFFTGNSESGKEVMRDAAKNLTPVTLQLGGKCPCIVDKEVNSDLASRRIVWGKYFNAGQTCAAPDYVLVHKDIKEELLEGMKKYIKQFYGDNASSSTDYARIIDEGHFERLSKFLNNGKIIIGGETDKSSLYIAPTIIADISWNDPVMQEEVFGPLLPILEYTHLSEAVAEVNKHPKPLALYFFSNNKRNQKRITTEIQFGGGAINDTIMHMIGTNLPFGGVGYSGIGQYHGKFSFDTFSHKKSIFKKSNAMDIKLRYPPYKEKHKFLRRLFFK